MNHKLNRNIINIIYSYNLPLKNKNINVLEQLEHITVSIKFCLDNRACYDKLQLYTDLKNTKIKLVKPLNYWTIKKTDLIHDDKSKLHNDYKNTKIKLLSPTPYRACWTIRKLI